MFKTVKDLKKALEKYDDNLPILISAEEWRMIDGMTQAEVVYAGPDFIWINEDCPEAEEAKETGCHAYKALIINCYWRSIEKGNPFYAK